MPLVLLPGLLLFLHQQSVWIAIGAFDYISISYDDSVYPWIKVFMSAYDQVVRVHEELDDGQEMITPLQFALLLTDWLDPDKTAAAFVHPVLCVFPPCLTPLQPRHGQDGFPEYTYGSCSRRSACIVRRRTDRSALVSSGHTIID